MFDLVSVGNAPLTMTSREVAELTGKRHDNVMVDIRKMLSELDLDLLTFQEVYTAGNGQEQKQYALPKRECLVLINSF